MEQLNQYLQHLANGALAAEWGLGLAAFNTVLLLLNLSLTALVLAAQRSRS